MNASSKNYFKLYVQYEWYTREKRNSWRWIKQERRNLLDTKYEHEAKEKLVGRSGRTHEDEDFCQTLHLIWECRREKVQRRIQEDEQTNRLTQVNSRSENGATEKENIWIQWNEWATGFSGISH